MILISLLARHTISRSRIVNECTGPEVLHLICRHNYTSKLSTLLKQLVCQVTYRSNGVFILALMITGVQPANLTPSPSMGRSAYPLTLTPTLTLTLTLM